MPLFKQVASGISKYSLREMVYLAFLRHILCYIKFSNDNFEGWQSSRCFPESFHKYNSMFFIDKLYYTDKDTEAKRREVDLLGHWAHRNNRNGKQPLVTWVNSSGMFTVIILLLVK